MSFVDAISIQAFALTAIGLLVFATMFRLNQIEIQLRFIKTRSDPQTLNVLAGCMLRGRICRMALTYLYSALAILIFTFIWAWLATALTWPYQTITCTGTIVSGGFILFASGLLIFELQQSL